MLVLRCREEEGFELGDCLGKGAISELGTQEKSSPGKYNTLRVHFALSPIEGFLKDDLVFLLQRLLLSQILWKCFMRASP